MTTITLLNRTQTIEKLRCVTIAPTQQRIELAQLIFARHQHFSAEELFNRVQALNAAVSKATVYNSLNLFVEKGLLRQVIVDPSRVFYDSNMNHHHHFYNVETGILTDIEDSHLMVNHLPPLPAGCSIDGVDVIIRIRNQPIR